MPVCVMMEGAGATHGVVGGGAHVLLTVCQGVTPGRP